MSLKKFFYLVEMHRKSADTIYCVSRCSGYTLHFHSLSPFSVMPALAANHCIRRTIPDGSNPRQDSLINIKWTK